MRQNVANEIYCPVCKNCYNQLNDICPVCGFGEADKIFVNVEDGEHWMSETVLAHKISWLNSREREIERRERLQDEKDNESEKHNSFVSGNSVMSEIERNLSREEILAALYRTNSRRVQRGNWIYYQNESSNNRIYRIQTDGTKMQQLTKDRCHVILFVDDDRIYYLGGASDNAHCYRICVDGTGRQRVD